MDKRTQGRNESGRERPSSWSGTLAGIVPFLSFGLAAALLEFLPHHPASRWLYIVPVYFVPLIGLGIGWARGFPRWSYPYGGLVLLCTLYWGGVATPGLRVLGHTFAHDELWGWRAWIPLAVMALTVLLWTRSLQPLGRLVAGIWQDWTRLAFALYGMAPFIVWLSFDEVQGGYEVSYLLAVTLLLVGGALVHLRSRRTTQQALALLLALVFSFAVAVTGVGIYWEGRLEFWMTEPASGLETTIDMGLAAVIVIVLTFSPVLIGGVRFAVDSLRSRQEAASGA